MPGSAGDVIRRRPSPSRCPTDDYLQIDQRRAERPARVLHRTRQASRARAPGDADAEALPARTGRVAVDWGAWARLVASLDPRRPGHLLERRRLLPRPLLRPSPPRARVVEVPAGALPAPRAAARRPSLLSTMNLTIGGVLSGTPDLRASSKGHRRRSTSTIARYGWVYTLGEHASSSSCSSTRSPTTRTARSTSRFLFRHVHRWHHRYVATSPFVVTAMHPAEFLLFQAVTFVPLFVIPFHYLSAIVVFVYILVFNIIDHSGVRLALAAALAGAEHLPRRPPRPFSLQLRPVLHPLGPASRNAAARGTGGTAPTCSAARAPPRRWPTKPRIRPVLTAPDAGSHDRLELPWDIARRVPWHVLREPGAAVGGDALVRRRRVPLHRGRGGGVRARVAQGEARRRHLLVWVARAARRHRERPDRSWPCRS